VVFSFEGFAGGWRGLKEWQSPLRHTPHTYIHILYTSNVYTYVMYVYTHVHTHAHARTHAHTHAHIHTCAYTRLHGGERGGEGVLGGREGEFRAWGLGFR
jgi:hypothetical protein